MSRIKQNARAMAAADDAVTRAWLAIDSLYMHGPAELRPHRTALLEMQERIAAML